MSLEPGQDIGMEIHDKEDQFIRIEQGTWVAVIWKDSFDLSDGVCVMIPKWIQHNITNTGDTDLKLYSIYSPAHHAPQTIHITKDDAIEAEKSEYH